MGSKNIHSLPNRKKTPIINQCLDSVSKVDGFWEPFIQIISVPWNPCVWCHLFIISKILVIPAVTHTLGIRCYDENAMEPCNINSELKMNNIHQWHSVFMKISRWGGAQYRRSELSAKVLVVWSMVALLSKMMKWYWLSYRR